MRETGSDKIKTNWVFCTLDLDLESPWNIGFWENKLTILTAFWFNLESCPIHIPEAQHHLDAYNVLIFEFLLSYRVNHYHSSLNLTTALPANLP